jgi:hypothetical protein
MNALMQLLLAALNLLLIMALFIGLMEIFGDVIVAMVVLFLAIAVFAWLTGVVKTKKPVDKQS